MPKPKHVVDKRLSGGPGRRVSIAGGRPPKHRRCVLCGGTLGRESVFGYHVRFAGGVCREVWGHADCLRDGRGHVDVRRTIGRYRLLMMMRAQKQRRPGRSQEGPGRIG